MLRRVAATIILLALAWGCGASAAVCRASAFEGDTFIVCRYGPAIDEIRLVTSGPGGEVRDFHGLQRTLGPDAERLRFAMNAGMYDATFAPLGLFVENGVIARPLNLGDGPGNFFLKPNGVFWVDEEGLPHVEATTAFAAARAHAVWATQSGPLLLADGVVNPRIAPEGQSRQIRNGVGVRGGKALFVISDGPVSFGRFARFFSQALGCRDALYLDGAVSSLWSPELGRRDDRARLATFVVVLNRREARSP
jgi:uncharacterized protein YigE (DUF2233 family)